MLREGTTDPGRRDDVPGAGHSRWAAVVAFGLLCAATQVLWVTYAPITDDAHTHFGVSKTAIGWLAQVFPLLYVLLAIPAGLMLDRWFRAALALGAAITAVGGLLRLVSDDYLWSLIGQVVVAVGQPLVLNAITGLTVHYLAEQDRATGIAVGSASTFAGLLIGFGIGSAFTGPGHVRLVIVISAVFALVAAVIAVIVLRTPGDFRVASAPAGLGAFRVAWRDRYLRRLCAIVFIPFGTFVAITTFAQPLLKPAGVSESMAGLILIANIVAGVAACAVIPVWAARHRRQLVVMTFAVVATAACYLLLALAAGVATGFVSLIVIGLLMLPALPMVFEFSERRAGTAEGTAAGLIWMAGNLGGLVVATVVGVLVDHPVPAFVLLAVLTLGTLPLLRSFARVVDAAEPADVAEAA